MTLYEYRCMACRCLFARRVAMASRDQPQACPECGKPGRRVLSRVQPWGGVWSQPRDPDTLRTTKEIWE